MEVSVTVRTPNVVKESSKVESMSGTLEKGGGGGAYGTSPVPAEGAEYKGNAAHESSSGGGAYGTSPTDARGDAPFRTTTNQIFLLQQKKRNMQMRLNTNAKGSKGLSKGSLKS